MGLLAEEKIIWTVPLPAWVRRIVAQVNSGVMTREQAMTGKKLLPLVEQYRLTLTTVTLTEEMERERLAKNSREKFEQERGISPANYHVWYIRKFLQDKETSIEYPAGDAMSKEEALALFHYVSGMASWATILVCLKEVEMRQVTMFYEEQWEQIAWKKIDLPVEWRTYDEFRAAFPRDLADACTEACNDLNPGLWRTEVDEEAKNYGGVTIG